MAKGLLVNVELDRGQEFLRALESADLPVQVALLAYLPEYSDWLFVLASRKLDRLGNSGAHAAIRRATAAAGIPIEHTPDIMMMPMNSAFIRDLRRRYGTSKNVEGMRASGTFGDRYIEDGYIYRIS
jgi:hypothetical protein